MASKEIIQDEKESNAKKLRTLFLALFPSLIIAGDYGGLYTNFALKGAVLFYQYVVIKGIVDSYYKYS